MQKRTFFIFFFVPWLCAAQVDTTVHILDDIQFDVQSVTVQSDTATVNLFLISSRRGQREFKMNTYASTVVDQRNNEHMYARIRMGRVLIRLEDRQNYLHYLLEQDVPVAMQLKFAGWQRDYGRPQAVQIVFEDHSEPGRFRQLTLPL